MDYNRFIGGGRLTRDPEIKYTGDGTAVAEFGIAINRQKGVDFFDVVAFDKMANFVETYFRKGKPIFIEGRIRLEQWESDGQKRSRVRVVAERVQFVGPKEDAATQEQVNGEDVPF
jgi:single-strand DNA-binding protein